MTEIVRLVTQYGLVLVFANVLLEQVGLPVPAVPTLVIAGALAAQGKLSLAALFAVAFAACVVGDTLWYAAGRRYGRGVMRLLCRISLSPDSCVRQTEVRFSQWGGWTLVLAKFIPGLSMVAPPLAGATRLGWIPFLLWNALGIAIWAGVAIGAGVLFQAQIGELLERLESWGALALQVIAALLALYVVLKWWERRRFYKMLRVARIGVDELRGLIQGDQRPIVVDVRSAASRSVDPRFIPARWHGQRPGRPAALSSCPADIVFYCHCPNEASAAQVAKKLMELGYPLRCGLHEAGPTRNGGQGGSHRRRTRAAIFCWPRGPSAGKRCPGRNTAANAAAKNSAVALKASNLATARAYRRSCRQRHHAFALRCSR